MSASTIVFTEKAEPIPDMQDEIKSHAVSHSGFFWIPAPVVDPDPGFARMTGSVVINDALV
jgi:hypothetical protein